MQLSPRNQLHEPDFYDFTSSSNAVHGVVNIYVDKQTGNEHISIYEWWSDDAAKGKTTKALEELRERFTTISAIGIGADIMDASWSYWTHMAAKGLVDCLEDDNGEDVVIVKKTQ